MRLALTAGGTGGHIFPALAVLAAMRERHGDALEVRFFGPENRGERAMVEPHGIPFVAIPSAGVRGRGPVQLAMSALRLAGGTLKAMRELRRYRPDAVFSTGGYASFPGSVAARVLRMPLVVYLPDVQPGWAVRAEQRLATRLTTTTEAALDALPRKKTTVTGYPVRDTFFAMDRAQARKELGITDDERVLLIAGASQGARAINRAIFGVVAKLAEQATVMHVTGEAGFAEAEEARQGLEPRLQERYVIAPFRSDLPVVMVAADLAVMRAGASVIGELPAAGLPALLIPGLFAGGHQRANAKWLELHGAAEVIDEEQLDLLAPRALALLGNPERLDQMAENARALARPDAARDIAQVVEEVARR